MKYFLLKCTLRKLAIIIAVDKYLSVSSFTSQNEVFAWSRERAAINWRASASSKWNDSVVVRSLALRLRRFSEKVVNAYVPRLMA